MSSPTPESVRLFIALDIPPPAQQVLATALSQFTAQLAGTTPVARWHITLWWIGPTPLAVTDSLEALTQPLAHSFVPTVTITHVGCGRRPEQLWAYIKSTPLLLQLRQKIFDRYTESGFPWSAEAVASFARPFMGHITLGTLQTGQPFGPPDTPVSISFAADHATLYHSDLTQVTPDYTVLGRIPLVAN